MTKSRQSAIKLRLSRLIRCLIGLCCLKLAIMGAAFFDMPMQAWFGESSAPQKQAAETAGTTEFSAPVTDETVAPVVNREDMPAAANEELPTGSAAAELAAAARPRHPGGSSQAALPAPLVPASRVSPLVSEGAAFIAPMLPEPPALGAPLAAAGVIVPEAAPAKKPADESIWDMLDIKSLPIPGLGSARAAHAAAGDMPVPSAPVQPSPFSPAEQLAPTAGQGGIVLPGAPPLPANLPTGQNPDGSPLPMRPGNPHPGQDNLLPPLPESVPTMQVPAPNIQGQPPVVLDQQTEAQDLARQQQDILMLRQQMDQRMKDLQSAEDKMKSMLREAKEVEDKKIKSLVQMYANMKPRMAAQALENMDDRVAVRILSRMAPKQSGEILTYTNPAKTAKFTEMITRMRLTE